MKAHPFVAALQIVALILHEANGFLTHPRARVALVRVVSEDSPRSTSPISQSTLLRNSLFRGTASVCNDRQPSQFDEDSETEDRYQDNHVNNRHSASDWFYNIRSLPQSAILREVKNPVLAVAGWSLVVSILHRTFVSSGLHGLAANMCIPGTMHSFLVSALGLLLVFRTNSAYQRFYEGRKIWENILSISRNLSRMIKLYSDEVGSERMSRIVSLVAAYPYLLRVHIRPGCLCKGDQEKIDPEYRLVLQEQAWKAVDTRYEGDKSQLLGRNNGGNTKKCWVDRRELPWSLFGTRSLKQVSKASNRPMWVCDRLGREIMSIPYGPNFTSRERLHLLQKVEKLTDAVGQCERIHQTAVPLNYARHALRSLTLWLFTLPFALVKDLGLLTAPVTACIAWILFGVYQIGYTIEDPFQGSLRLSILCDAIRRDIIGECRARRESAYSLEDSWEPTYELPIHNVAPMSSQPPSNLPLLNDQETLLNLSPKIVQKNGTWTVVVDQ